MKKTYFQKKIKYSIYILLLFMCTNLFSQVGIGTTTPSASSALDISSTTQGMLTPRMTTAQRGAIVTPADGLIVYDTDLKSFYHFNITTLTWVRLNSEATGRTNFKRIKSTDVLATILATELAAGGGSKYLLNTNTLYEINGTISLNLPIDLNNAYISGLDTNEDKLVRAGVIFQGSTGGGIRNLTLSASTGSVFSLSGNAAENLIFRDCVVASSASVGSISGFGLVFVSIVQFSGNTAGITYNNIRELLISNVGWFGNNTGTFETLTGTFTLVQKQGGFSSVNGTAVGFDVSSNPNISGDAVLESVVFTGTLSAGGFYVKPYTIGNYVGYNFNNSWNVRSAGIPTEADASATGNLYLNRALALPTGSLPALAPTIYKIPGTTIASNLFRSSSPTSNRLIYLGKKSRNFVANCSLSFEGGPGATDLLFFFVKFSADGSTITIVENSYTFIDSNTANVQSFSINGSVTLATGEYIEICAQRLNGTNKVFTFQSYNMTLK